MVVEDILFSNRRSLTSLTEKNSWQISGKITLVCTVILG